MCCEQGCTPDRPACAEETVASIALNCVVCYSLVLWYNNNTGRFEQNKLIRGQVVRSVVKNQTDGTQSEKV